MSAPFLVRAVPVLAILAACSPADPDSAGVDTDTSAPGVVYREQSVTLVADHDELVALGLEAWPDSIVGFATGPGGETWGYAFGIDGDVMRATFTEDVGAITEAVRAPVTPTPPPGEWWGSGGPVYHDEATGLLLMVTHDEDPDVSLRMAKSTDWGLTWTDLGQIVDHHPGGREHRYMGNGGFLLVPFDGETYLVVYHADAQPPDAQNQVAASRARLADVIDAALADETPVFHKWDGEGWSEPSLGGRSVDLMPDLGVWGVVGDIDPYWVPALDRYVAFYPSQIDGSVWPPTWNLYQSFSEDGLRWSPAVKVYAEDLVGGDPIYVGVRAHNRVITDESPVLVRMRCTDDDDRWGSSTLERVTLELVDAAR